MFEGGIVLIGAIIGDIVGSRFEFNNHRNKNFKLFAEDCHVTDDSIMTLAIAKAIMETERAINKDYEKNGYYSLLEEMSVRYMQEIGRKYPDVVMDIDLINGFFVRILNLITVLEMGLPCG